MHGPIASAVILPDELVAPASPSSHKRRQSYISESSVKRQRLDGDKDPEILEAPVKVTVPVRPERGRERRLFGAALGALSQNSATAAQKRRSEIEKRQQAQQRQQDEESEQRKIERLARRKEQRWSEQKRFEEDLMWTRHDMLRAMANFLQTETEPRLFYKPWETTASEDYRIQNQIAEAEETIKREMEECDTRQQQDTMGKRVVRAQNNRAVEDSNTGKDNDVQTTQNLPLANGGTCSSAQSPEDLEMKDDLAHDPGNEAATTEHNAEVIQINDRPIHDAIIDDSGKEDDDENGEDVVEEAAEDTVIY